MDLAVLTVALEGRVQVVDVLIQQVCRLGVGRVEHHLKCTVGGLGQLYGEIAEVLGAELNLQLPQSLLGRKADGVGQVVVHVGLLGIQLEVLAHLHRGGLHVLEQGLICHDRSVQAGVLLIVVFNSQFH